MNSSCRTYCLNRCCIPENQRPCFVEVISECIGWNLLYKGHYRLHFNCNGLILWTAVAGKRKTPPLLPEVDEEVDYSVVDTEIFTPAGTLTEPDLTVPFITIVVPDLFH